MIFRSGWGPCIRRPPALSCVKAVVHGLSNVLARPRSPPPTFWGWGSEGCMHVIFVYCGLFQLGGLGALIVQRQPASLMTTCIPAQAAALPFQGRQSPPTTISPLQITMASFQIICKYDLHCNIWPRPDTTSPLCKRIGHKFLTGFPRLPEQDGPANSLSHKTSRA